MATWLRGSLGRAGDLAKELDPQIAVDKDMVPSGEAELPLLKQCLHLQLLLCTHVIIASRPLAKTKCTYMCIILLGLLQQNTTSWVLKHQIFIPHSTTVGLKSLIMVPPDSASGGASPPCLHTAGECSRVSSFY